MRQSFRIDGARELEAALRKLGAEVAGPIGEAAQKEAAEELRDELIVHAPYDPGSTKRTRRRAGGRIATYDYGHLRENIEIVLGHAKHAGRIIYHVGTGDAFWARFLELGTAKMPAHPWMRPVFKALVSRLIATQARELKAGIEKVAAAAPKGG